MERLSKSETSQNRLLYVTAPLKEDLKPGKFYTINFDLQPDDQIIKKGQQIGFMIFSSDPEFTLHPKAGTELNIKLDKTKLKLPVVGGKDAFEKAVN